MKKIERAIILSTALHIILFIFIFWISDFRIDSKEIKINHFSSVKEQSSLFKIDTDQTEIQGKKIKERKIEKTFKKKEKTKKKIESENHDLFSFQDSNHDRKYLKQIVKKNERNSSEHLATRKKKSRRKNFHRVPKYEHKKKRKQPLVLSQPIKKNNVFLDKNEHKNLLDKIKTREEQSNIEKINQINKIINSIKRNLYNAPLYKGKKCTIWIQLPRTGGKIKKIEIIQGDSKLCQAAISATKLIDVPNLSNLKKYDVYKDATIEFSL